jgi:preprotein translocase subunit SecE
MDSSKSQGSKSAPMPVPRSKRGFKGFYREVSREMKHVHWPTRQETTRLTGVVLGVCLLVVLLLTALSYIFGEAFQIIVTGGA